MLLSTFSNFLRRSFFGARTAFHSAHTKQALRGNVAHRRYSATRNPPLQTISTLAIFWVETSDRILRIYCRFDPCAYGGLKSLGRIDHGPYRKLNTPHDIIHSRTPYSTVTVFAIAAPCNASGLALCRLWSSDQGILKFQVPDPMLLRNFWIQMCSLTAKRSEIILLRVRFCLDPKTKRNWWTREIFGLSVW